MAAAQVRTLARGAGVAVVGTLGGRALHIVGQLVAARLLGPLLFGEYTVAWTLLSTLGVVAILGMVQAVLRFGSEPWERGGEGVGPVVVRALGIAGIAGGLVGAVVFVWAEPIAVRAFGSESLAPVLRTVAPAFLLFGPVRVASAATRVPKSTRWSAVFEWTGQPAVALVLILALALGGLSVLDAVLALVLSFALALVGLLWAIPRALPGVRFRGPAAADSRTLLLYGLPAGLGATLTLLTMRVDRLLIAYFRPETEVGLYQAASQSALLFTLVLSAFTSILMPMASASHAAGRTGELDALFKVTTRWSLTLCLPLFFVMLLAPEFVIVGIYGQAYAAAVVPLQILAVAQLVNAGTGAVGPILLMTGREGAWARLAAAVFAFVIVANLFAIPVFGAVGAAWTLTMASVVLFGAGLTILRSSLGIFPWDRRYLGLLMPALASGVAVAVTRTVVPVGFVGLVVLAAVATGTMFVLLALRGLTPEDRVLLDALRGRASSPDASGPPVSASVEEEG